MTDHADIVRERVSHIARGCRAGTSHNPAVYENDINAALDALVAERDNAVAKGQSRLRCWLFGHDWKRREWHVLGTCDRCGKKEAGS
jgi:hypothetical protein